MTDEMKAIYNKLGETLQLIDSKEGWEFLFFFYMFLFLGAAFLILIAISTPLMCLYLSIEDLIKKVRNIV